MNINIKKIVNKLVKLHDTHDPFLIAHYEGIHILFEDFKNIKGSFFQLDDKKFIVVNNCLDEFSRHVVCAHELGHALLHNSEEIAYLKEHTLFPAHSKSEREANKFAAHLILHDDFDIAFFYADGQPFNQAIFEKLVQLKESK